MMLSVLPATFAQTTFAVAKHSDVPSTATVPPAMSAPTTSASTRVSRPAQSTTTVPPDTTAPTINVSPAPPAAPTMPVAATSIVTPKISVSTTTTSVLPTQTVQAGITATAADSAPCNR